MKTEAKLKTDLTKLVDTELSKYIVERDLGHTKRHQGTAQKLSILDYDSISQAAKISDYTGSITADYQLDIDFVDTRLSGGLQKVKGQSHIEDSKEATADMDRKINIIDDSLTPLVGKFDDTAKKHEPEVKFFNRWIKPMIVLIATIELVANFEIFALLGGGLLTNIATALLTAVFVHWYGFFTPSKVRQYSNGNPKKELLIFLSFLIPLSLLFYKLSIMRIDYLIALNPDMDGVLVSNPLVFTMINIFAYVIICWLVIAYKPSKKIINSYKQYRNDLKAIQRLKEEKELLESERNKLASELRYKLTDRYNILLLGQQKEKEICTRMQACFEQFKLELFLKTNGACAPLFTGDIDKDLPKLKLNYQNVQYKIETS